MHTSHPHILHSSHEVNSMKIFQALNVLLVNRSIGRKMIAFCLVLLILPIGIVGEIGYKVARNETNALIEKDLQHTVKFAIQMAGLLQRSVEEGLMSLEEAQELMKQTLLGPLREDGTRPINRDIDLGENGYFFVLDYEGNLLAHPTMEGQNIWDRQSSDGVYYIQDMIEKGRKGGGFTFYEWPLPDMSAEALKVSYAEAMPEWGWVFGAGSYFQDYNAGQFRILFALWTTLAVCVIVGSVLVYAFARYLFKPLRTIANYSEEIARGNLAVQPLSISRKDEIGMLADRFNGMVRTLRSLVRQAMDASDSVRRSARELAQAMSESTAANRQVESSIAALSEGIENQAKGTEESARVIQEMTQGIQQIAETSSAAFEAAGEMSRQAQKGNELMRHSAGQMDAVSQTFKDIVSTFENLTQYSAKIEEISAAIGQIANQTKVLALNASIEAARAGEHGKGFAVVAEEVRKLAGQSADFTLRITELADAVRQAAGNAEQAVARSDLEVRRGVSAIHETGIAFQSILDAAQHSAGKIEETSAAVEQMSAASQEIAASIQEISHIAGESSGKAREIATAAHDQQASLERIDRRIRELEDEAERLREQVNRFQV